MQQNFIQYCTFNLQIPIGDGKNFQTHRESPILLASILTLSGTFFTSIEHFLTMNQGQRVFVQFISETKILLATHFLQKRNHHKQLLLAN